MDRQFRCCCLCFKEAERGKGRDRRKGGYMLYWALVFLIIAIIAALFGFAGVATAAVGIAKLLFYIFLVIFVITLIMGLMRRVVRRRCSWRGAGRHDVAVWSLLPALQFSL